ncbi:MAG TPA: nucleoside deaminase [Candidatus Omnitrophota bacterium]|nr:nucleoside deaminase [Candidatus Omnitrophota bacterium]HPS19475.1 nucleoside deaminase [Candidatus Omnitrophota bacterium]
MASDSREKFMKLAIDEAYAGINAGDGGPFGAVVTRNGEVIASAHNTVLKNNNPTQHGEMNAITLASQKLKNYDLSGCEIYSTVEPCPMCFSAIHWARIDKVIFGGNIEDVWKLGFNEMPVSDEKLKELSKSPVIIEKGFMRAECMELLAYWSNLANKKVY